MNPTCYDNVIGLSREQCPCQPQGPTDFNTSRSGLYLTDIAPLGEIGNYKDCSAGGMWDILNNARSQAVTAFIADASALLMRNNKSRRTPWRGGVGMAEKGAALVTGDAFQGLRVCGAGIRGGTMTIEAISTQFVAVGTFDVVVYDWQGTEVARREVTTVANKQNITPLAVPIVLPLHDKYRALPEYYIVYDTSLAPAPVDSRIACGCGATVDYYYNSDTPRFHAGHKSSELNGWANWIMLAGWRGADVEFAETTPTGYNKNHGLSLLCSFDCKVHEVLCEDSLNFSKPLTMSAAFAIYFKAAEITFANLLTSAQLTRFGITKPEAIENRRKEMAAKYNEHLVYITNEIDVRANDCLDCRSIVSMTSQGVFA